MVISLTSAASSAFSAGTMQRRAPASLAAMTMGSTPFILLTSPLSPSSPAITVSSTTPSLMSPKSSDAIKRAIAIGRSKAVPCFFLSAGEIFTVMRFGGSLKPLFEKALLILSLASLTSDETNPTSSNTGIPPVTSASTATGRLSMPFNIAELTF